MKVQDKIDLTERIKTFFRLNWWLVWITNVLICYFVYTTTHSMSVQNEQVKTLLEKEVKGVVFVGSNGQVVFGQKQLIDGTDASFKKAVKNILVNYLITDGERLTKSYTIKNIKTVDDVYTNNELLREFHTNFLADKDPAHPETIELFKSMLLGLARAVSQDTIPEQIVPIDSTISNYIWNDKDQTFEIIINVKANTYVYNSIHNNYDLKEGTIQIRAKGYFDLFHNNNINPLGVQFFDIGLTNASK